MNRVAKIVVFILIILVILSILLNVRVQPSVVGNPIQYEDICDQMKTGDVITMNTSHWLKRTVISNYLGCDAIHVGMVVRVLPEDISSDEVIIPPLEVTSSKGGKKGELYLLEIGPYGTWPYRQSDVRFTPLVKALKACSHHVFGWVPCEKELRITDQDLRHYRDYKYNYFVPTMFAPYKKYKVCSTFVAKIHEDKGIGSDHHLISPCKYHSDPNLISFQI